MKVDLKCTLSSDGETISIDEIWPYREIKSIYKTKDEMVKRQLEHSFIIKERNLEEVLGLIDDVLAVNGVEILPCGEQLEIKKRDESCGIIRDWL